ncbi:endonuclease [Rubrobacter xylanophilus]|uniref:Endonuclease n=1 Tax=Rubrobacter xylanophilus TaxID=49319 RepID=A0A510HE86_9ACTN|nr:endonuclease/exonuclease/phosphatase family protein [Rubrobacter xylanophilus]BBL78242.1 endonuclease [Rubrobacter xylanophilus]
MYPLRVMTFNVRGAYHLDGRNVWRRRRGLNARIIREASPDLIGFQELQRGNLGFYERELPSYRHMLGPAYENHPPRAYNAIFWNPELLELAESGGFWLSETPERFSRSWGSRQVRSAHWARFRAVPEGPEFVHLNTHLDHVSGEARRQGSRLITGWLGEVRLPVLVTGDFNCNPGSKTYEIFASAGFSDVHRRAGNPPENTFHRFMGEGYGSAKEGRIDWILVRDGAGARWEVLSCRTVRDCEPPLYPSDHYPVVADLALSPGV